MSKETEPNPLWETTSTQNLIRYRPSGTYFARFKVGGKPVRQSLNTTVLSVAKQRLGDKITEYRSREESVKAFANGKMTVGDAALVYMKKIGENPALSPNSKIYYRAMYDYIRRTWPALLETDVRKVTERDCQTWLAGFQKQYAPITVNNSIAVLRGIFKEAIDAGARFNNPAAELQKMRILPKRLELPSREQFAQFVEAIRTSGEPKAEENANLVRLLAYSGMRLREAENLIWRDVDLTKRQLLVRGEPDRGTKNGEWRYVPMIPELEGMLKELQTQRTGEPPTAAVMRVSNCERSMTKAAVKIGMARITHHDLRHFFATICIESGVDIPTVSRWLGHRDGGVLCMKTYGHLRQEHSFAQAQRVNFSTRMSV